MSLQLKSEADRRRDIDVATERFAALQRDFMTAQADLQREAQEPLHRLMEALLTGEPSQRNVGGGQWRRC